MRALGVSAWLFVLLTACGCGSGKIGASDSGSGTEPAATTTDPQEGDAYWTWTSWTISEAREQAQAGPPTATKLAVFREPAMPSDSLVPYGEEDAWDLDEAPEGFRPGRELFDDTRLLVPPAEAEGFRLFGVPTEKGWVCLHFFYPNGAASGNCSRELTEGIDYVISGTERRYVVYGLVADDVRDVKVEAHGKSWPTLMGRNAFIFQADPRKICPTEIESLILEQEKGPSQVVTIGAPGPDESPQPDRDASFGCR